MSHKRPLSDDPAVGEEPTEEPADGEAPAKRQQTEEPAATEEVIGPVSKPDGEGAAAAGSGDDAASDKPSVPVSFVLTSESAKAILVIKAMIGNVAAGSVIGKGGEIVAAIRAMAQCKISLTESNPSLPERMITFTGTHGQIMAAFDTVYEKMLQGEAETTGASAPPTQFTLKLMLSNNQVGSLMGKGGTAVQSIRDTTGANIRVASPKEMPFGSHERLTSVIGETSAVRAAFRMLCAAIANSPSLPTSSPAPAPSAALTYSAYSAPTHAAPAHTLASTPAYSSYYGSQFGTTPYQQAAPVTAVPPGMTTATMHVPDDNIGRVIGKAGSTVAEIRSVTGCNIHVAKKEPTDWNRLVTITGYPDNIKLAQTLISMKMTSPHSVSSLLASATAAAGVATGYSAATAAGYSAATGYTPAASGYSAAGYSSAMAAGYAAPSAAAMYPSSTSGTYAMGYGAGYGYGR